MEMERRQLRERREGKLRRALGVPLPGESFRELDEIGEKDRRMAGAGLVGVMRKGKVVYEPLDGLTVHDVWPRIAAERAQIAWLKERIERRKRETPPV